MNNTQFFDQNFNRYVTRKLAPDDSFFIKFIKHKNESASILDIGGGSGEFARKILILCPEVDVTVLDPSSKMLEQIHDTRIKITLGSLPNNVPLAKYKYIHIRDVLHHITGESPGESKELVKKSLMTIYQLLDEDGYLLLSDEYDEGYFYAPLPRIIIFYLLKTQNKLGFKIPIQEFLLGLTTCFYTRRELQDLLENAGFHIHDVYQSSWQNIFKKHLLFIKNWGRISFIAQKKTNSAADNGYLLK